MLAFCTPISISHWSFVQAFPGEQAKVWGRGTSVASYKLRTHEFLAANPGSSWDMGALAGEGQPTAASTPG